MINAPSLNPATCCWLVQPSSQGPPPPTIGRLQVDCRASQVGTAGHPPWRVVCSQRLEVEVVADLGVIIQAGIDVKVPGSRGRERTAAGTEGEHGRLGREELREAQGPCGKCSGQVAGLPWS